jgi:hypothetical protein
VISPADDARPLQFETAIPRGVAPDAPAERQGVTCVACQQTLLDEYFDVNGEQVCASCRDAIAQRGESPRGSIPLARAGLFGIGAAIAGAVLYYAVIAITDFEIGLVAIAIGYMVGYAIRMGTGGRGGRKFQVMALVLTYWSVGLAYVPLALKGATEQTEQSVQSEGGAPAAQAETSASAQSAEPSAANEEFSITVALAYLFGFSLALPVLVVVGSLPGGLISGAIIGFGMQQAWRMTGAPQLTITGPFRVGAAEIAAT